ncbi:aromatic acid/H+ symport family MFS transporter [Streptomyces griseoviridis]|jgi:AAHS family benzoate transporter-like MFS transporter|uniref:AAHS family benzoate transporter-like MFS transporter n=2 Tax=Streptomyces griseoviridis TaxID=45398 RepID=A0ABT9LPT4_STRGD|nr:MULTISPECIES: aromatic acid/H+ symport family MFS transporter [Streptomyces]MDP9685548.1 AAHS family benzoate transporter-like MFS transporter [Streptomyces griseoviridis]GGS32227.1 MFS transporter [Streptomyces niveoruber]GGS88227.1 MFS transporter [Streptomyces griseoviridis]
MSSSLAPSSRGSRLALLVVLLCWVAVLFDGLDMFIYGSVLPHMLQEKALGITSGQAGDLGSYATFGMLVGALAAGTIADRIGRKKLMLSCVTLFSLASGLCAVAGSVAVFGLGRTLAGVGLGGLLPTAISMVSDYAPRGRAALTIGLLMTAHHAGGILSAYVALWIVEPLGWRAAFWVCVVPLLFVPVLLKWLPESLSFLVAQGRRAEASELAARYDAELPAAPAARTAGARWGNLAALFQGREWIQTLLYWLASFGGLLLVYGVATWLPTLMRSEGYELGSALTFVVLFNLGGVVGMLVAGRASDRFGAPRISALWFALTAAGVFLLSVHMPLALTFVVVFLTGVFLNSAQVMIYATVSIGSTPDSRATAVGWTSGMGRFGAVFGPWLGGQLLAANNGDWGFTAFALAGVSSMVFIGIAAARTGRRTAGGGSGQQLVGAAH